MKRFFLAAAVASVVAAALILGPPGRAHNSASPLYQEPSWSPNGRLIALISSHDNPNAFPDVYVMNADGSGMRRVTHGQSECPASDPCGHGTPAWSPNGKRLAYQAFAFLDAIDLDGTHHDRLWNRVGANGGACCPAWSPNGHKIAFTYRANSEGAGGRSGSSTLTAPASAGSSRRRTLRSPSRTRAGRPTENESPLSTGSSRTRRGTGSQQVSSESSARTGAAESRS